MKIIIAPDSFKESLSAKNVALAIQKGLMRVWPLAEYVLIPMADGGEGTVEAIIESLHGELITEIIHNPLNEKTSAYYGLSQNCDIAVIEMSQASGLHLITDTRRNPLIATSFGTGELIRSALDRGARHLIIGLGGSATNDGGAGMLSALGVRFLDKNHQQLAQGGAALIDLEYIDISALDPRLKECTIEVACDVNNPLYGPKGASHVFGPQKGASAEMVLTLDSALMQYAKIIDRDVFKNPEQSINEVSGAGAAGGMGAALVGVLNATMMRGIDLVIKATRMESQMSGANYVFTGEGKIDGQTIFGKTPIGVAKIAKRHQIPTIALVGTIGNGYEAVFDDGIDAVFSILSGPCSLPEALANAASNLSACAENIARLITVKPVN